jgi:hypothetical protein
MSQPKVVIMCDEGSFGRYPHQRDLDRLATFTEVEFVPCQAVPDPGEPLHTLPPRPRSIL